MNTGTWLIARVVVLPLFFVCLKATSVAAIEDTCPYDYDVIQRVGTTNYQGNPIKIIEQSTYTVRFTVGNTWTTGDDSLDQVFVSYPQNAAGERDCYLGEDILPGTSIGKSLVAYCTQSGVAMVRVYVRDAEFDYARDSATIPSGCSSLDTSGISKPGLEYMAILSCSPTCTKGEEVPDGPFDITYPTLTPTNKISLFSCPEPGEDSVALPSYVGGELIELENSATGSVCTLVNVNSVSLSDADNLETGMEPVARSYNGYEWEASAGKYSSAAFDCSQSGSCKVVLPIARNGRSYVLKSYNSPSLTDKNVKARFLEKTTFGPTRSDIEEFTNAADWLKDQFEMEMSTHRAFFRQHLTQWHAETNHHTLLDTNACQEGARFRRYTFTPIDRYRMMQTQTSASDSSKVVISVDGQKRSIVDGPLQCGNWRGVDETTPIVQDGEYNICQSPLEGLEGRLRISTNGVNCNCEVNFGGVYGNPKVHFDDDHLPDLPVLDIKSSAVPILGGTFYLSDVENELVQLSTNLTGSQCNEDLARTTGAPDIVRVGKTVNSDGTSEYWIHTTSFKMANNEIASPLLDGGKSAITATADAPYNRMKMTCASAPRTFLNEDSCVLSDNACYAQEGPDVVIELSLDSLKKIHTVTGGENGEDTRYVYAVKGLRFDADSLSETGYPCAPNARSRWIRISGTTCENADTIGEGTKSVFSSLLRNSDDNKNDILRDIFFPTGTMQCDSADASAYGFKVTVDNECWEHTHPDNHQVFDFTYWTTDAHPGNFKENKIKAFADGEEPTWELAFPGWHSMDRWHKYMGKFPNVGRLGDNTTLKSLPLELFREDVAQAFGSTPRTVAASGSVLVCGSPFEVATKIDAESGPMDKGGFGMHTYRNFTVFGREEQRTAIWMHIALKGKDQLRQKIAFALSQIVVMSPDSIGSRDYSEPFLAFYDIFVRHAFGNYFDILKEVTYSSLMAEMLTYKDGASTGYSWGRHWYSSQQSPDENYAREIMQLFSIGIRKLNDDGTLQLDSNGNPMLTYTNSDIAEYAKVYTGFSRHEMRSNIETAQHPGQWRNNQVDPLKIDAKKKDHLPKLGLDSQYIGDGYPLCSDIPYGYFLKAGAKYRLLGSISDPDLLNDPVVWHKGPPKRISLDFETSLLSSELCGGNVSQCKPPTTYILDDDIPCNGVECDIDEARTFEVAPGIWYEYVRPPCVNVAFYQDPKTIHRGSHYDKFMCGNPKNRDASTLCCQAAKSWDVGWRNELFSGERVKFDLATTGRCNEEDGFRNCNSFTWLRGDDCASRLQGGCDRSYVWYWIDQECTLFTKISRVGTVAVIHEHGLGSVNSQYTEYKDVRNDTKSYFRADWQSDNELERLLRDYDVVCTDLGGNIDPYDGLCQFAIVEETTKLFNADSEIKSIENVLAKATIGALPPTIDGEDIPGVNGIRKYPKGDLSAETVFEFVDGNGRKHLRKNIVSIVSLGNGGLKMRNPVSFFSLSEFTERDARYELDAALHHFFYHDNTAPFLATRIAQRLGISNPAPRYIKKAAIAFRTGKYEGFGSGKYGCLKATVAALLLDREFQDSTLDGDPTQGSVREPFLKIVHLMRALEYEPSLRSPFLRLGKNLQDAIGQECHKLPNVFSFFKPEYAPAGKIASAGLVSPEAQVLNGPTSVAMANMMLAFVKYGVNDCYGGFGRNNVNKYGWEKTQCIIGESTNWGSATYDSSKYNLNTAEEVVDDLSTLLTSGRLSEENKQLIVDAYKYTMTEMNDPYEAMVNAQQLITLSPEFHTTNTPTRISESRSIAAKPNPSGEPYKAVIYVNLAGGADSYNMLVPNVCSGTNADGVSVADQYLQERQELAFNRAQGEFGVAISASNQPCSSFAVHDELKLVKELYDGGDLLWVANTGVVNENGMTASTFNAKTRTQLFAHNAMEEETKKVDPWNDMVGTGVLGRANDVLSKTGHVVGAMNIDQSAIVLNGVAGIAPAPRVVSSQGIDSFGERPDGSKWWIKKDETYFDVKGYADRLNGETSAYSGVYGELWSDVFTTGIKDAEYLRKDLEENANLDASLWTDPEDWDERHLTTKLKTVAALIQTHENRNTDREAFYLAWGGFDHHGEMKSLLRAKMKKLNASLKRLVTQLKNDGLWDQTVIYVTSEFARTLTPNQSAGSDHAWAQHVMVMGGSVKGGQIKGTYPTDITANSPLETGTERGRFMPTTSNDAIWNSILQWYGVTGEDQLDRCLPNRLKTINPVAGEPDSPLLTLEDLFDV